MTALTLRPRPRGSGWVLRAVRLVVAAQVPVAAVEELEHGGHVLRPVDAVADDVGIEPRIGRLGIPVLDELFVLRMPETQLGHATVAIEDAELEMLVAHEGGTVRTSLDPYTGPGVKLIGDLIDEHGRMGHGPIVPGP
jgi:hypothetical protein